MARDALVALLADVRRGGSLEELRGHLEQIHAELADIQRKRSHFLEDACAAVLAQSFRASARDSDSDRDDVYEDATDQESIFEAVSVCLGFLESLVRELPPVAASEDSDVTRQRGVLVAFALSILGRSEVMLDDKHSPLHDACRRLASLVLATGISVETIAWTLRFREEVNMFRSMMLPVEDDSDREDVDDMDEDEEEDGDDAAWIVHTVAVAAGRSGSLEYFLKGSGHEYAFASWSPVGIVRVVVMASSRLLEESIGGTVSVTNPYSNMFAVAAVGHALLQGQTLQTKHQGLVVLMEALDKCPPGKLAIGSLSSTVPEPAAQSFVEAAAAFRSRDWITPLVELVSNAMVSAPEADDRALGLTVFRQLLQVVDVEHRFWLIWRLATRCPYGNVAAILVDQLRNDTFRVWSNPGPLSKLPPQMSTELTVLIVNLLKLLVERDLKMHADLLASVASLIRFVAIRDKMNQTGLRVPDTLEAVKASLGRLQSRLRSTMAESVSTSHATDLHSLLHDENARLALVEVALDSTIALLSN